VAPPTVGVRDAFGVPVAASGTILRTIVPAGTVSESGGGGGGIGVGGAVASAKVVEEATPGLTEGVLLAAAALADAELELFELEAALATLLTGVSPLLRTFVHRRPWNVVMFVAIQTAVQSACGAKWRVYGRRKMGVAQA
jgi:hypothetical protein